MQNVTYDDVTTYPLRKNFAESHTRYWQRLQTAGNWFSASERIAIAQATREAHHCPLCTQRKEALSPRTESGTHLNETQLRPVIVEAVHAIVTDASRLTNTWVENLLDNGLTDGEYIELVGTVVSMVSIDSFAEALGIEYRALPTATNGKPSLYRPATAEVTENAWLPMVSIENEGTPEADLWPSGKTGNVVRAMSLVPDEVRTLKDLSDVHYLEMPKVRQPGVDAGRALNRSQMELIAGRVSALNACFYWTTAHASMLRASTKTHEQSIKLDAIMHGGNAGEIDHANELAAFAEAIVSRDPNTITIARDALADAAGHAVMADAAGVASNFQRMVRIADSTGIILGDFDAPTAQMRQSLGIDKFNTQEYHSLTVLPRR